MINYNTSGPGFRPAIKSDGTKIDYSGQTGYCTLVAGSTYYFMIGGDHRAALESAHLQWSAAFAGTITFEDSNMPERISGIQGPALVNDYDASTDGSWIPENPSTAIVAVVGTGNSSSAATVTAGGTNAGGCLYHVGNFGARRGRIKVVCTTGGNVRCNMRSKVGG